MRYGSAGADAAAKLSERNRRLFAARWTSRLEGRPPTFTGASEQAAIASRDACARPRLLVCSGDDPPTLEPLAGALIAGWPRARLTWWTDGGPASFDRERWLASGVEVLDGGDARWLSARRFHYDVVIGTRGLAEGRLKAVDSTQPQAPVLLADQLGERPATPSRLITALARSGIAPEG